MYRIVTQKRRRYVLFLLRGRIPNSTLQKIRIGDKNMEKHLLTLQIVDLSSIAGCILFRQLKWTSQNLCNDGYYRTNYSTIYILHIKPLLIFTWSNLTPASLSLFGWWRVYFMSAPHSCRNPIADRGPQEQHSDIRCNARTLMRDDGYLHIRISWISSWWWWEAGVALTRATSIIRQVGELLDSSVV